MGEIISRVLLYVRLTCLFSLFLLLAALAELLPNILSQLVSNFKRFSPVWLACLLVAVVVVVVVVVMCLCLCKKREKTRTCPWPINSHCRPGFLVVVNLISLRCHSGTSTMLAHSYISAIRWGSIVFVCVRGGGMLWDAVSHFVCCLNSLPTSCIFTVGIRAPPRSCKSRHCRHTKAIGIITDCTWAVFSCTTQFSSVLVLLCYCFWI